MNQNVPTHSRLAFFRLLFFSFLFFGSFVNASATHLAGGDIEYECIGPRKWKVRLIVYRYCGTSAAVLCQSFSCNQLLTATPSPAIANGGLNPNGCISSPSSIPFNIQLVKVEAAEKSRELLCGSSGKNECNNLGTVTPGPYAPGYEKYTFEGELNMDIPSLNNPNTCPYWDIGWNYCCRNSTENVQGQPSFHIQATINIFDQGAICTNNSPILKQEAIITFCAGQEHIINMGAVDPDHDSLSYEIIKSLQGPNIPVTYNPPYSERYPFPLVLMQPPHPRFPTRPSIILDSLSGDISLKPLNTTTNPISGDFSVQITQWRKREEPAGSGIMKPYIVGRTMRNLQLLSVPCAGNNPPRFATTPALPNGAPKYDWSVCAGEQVCFTITATDQDAGDSTYITWTNGTTSGGGQVTFTPDYDTVAIPSEKPREDRWKFCWQTSDSSGSNVPYFFTVRADDSKCPNPGRVIRNFAVHVMPAPSVQLVKTKTMCEEWTVRLNKLDAATPFGSVKLEVALTPGDYSFANGARTVYAANPNPAANGSLLVADTMKFAATGIYPVRYTIIAGDSDDSVCPYVFYDSLEVLLLPLKAVIPGDTVKCKTDTIDITGAASGGNPPYSYRWFRNNMTGIPVNGPNFLVNNSFRAGDQVTTKYILRVQDINGCTSTDSLVMHVKSIPANTITASDSAVCDRPGGNEIAFWHSAVPAFSNYTRMWVSDSSWSADSVFTVTFTGAGVRGVRLVISDDSGCSDTAWASVSIKPLPAIVPIQGPVTGLVALNEYDYFVDAASQTTYTWSVTNGSFVAGSTGDTVRVKWTSAGPGVLAVEQNLDDCIATDSLGVTIGSVGLKEASALRNISVRPNPNNGLFTIGLESVRAHHISATLHDVLGKEVWKTTMPINAGTSELPVNVDVPDGIYMLTVYDQESKTVKRVLVNR